MKPKEEKNFLNDDEEQYFFNYLRNWWSYITQIYLDYWLDALEMAIFIDLDNHLFGEQTLEARRTSSSAVRAKSNSLEE